MEKGIGLDLCYLNMWSGRDRAAEEVVSRDSKVMGLAKFHACLNGRINS